MTASPDLTGLLLEWNEGDDAALEKLTPLVYSELRQLADNFIRQERADHTLQATALVHEAYLKLVDQRSVRWQDRAHFYAVAAQDYLGIEREYYRPTDRGFERELAMRLETIRARLRESKTEIHHGGTEDTETMGAYL